MMAQNNERCRGNRCCQGQGGRLHSLAIVVAHVCKHGGRPARTGCLVRRKKVGKAVMEASGGYERDWAKALRKAGIEVRIVDPKQVRSFARSAGRLAKNDLIDAEMIAWFARRSARRPTKSTTRNATSWCRW